MRTKFSPWLATTVLLAVLFAQNALHAQGQRVFSFSDGFSTPYSVVINNSGEVAFQGERRATSGERFRGVYKGKAGVSTVLEHSMDNPPVVGQLQLLGHSYEGDAISINNGGAVSFYGWRGAGSTIVVFGQGEVRDTGVQSGVGAVTITDDGFLAYHRTVRSPDIHIFAYSFPGPAAPVGPMNNRHQFLRAPGANLERITLGFRIPTLRRWVRSRQMSSRAFQGAG